RVGHAAPGGTRGVGASRTASPDSTSSGDRPHRAGVARRALGHQEVVADMRARAILAVAAVAAIVLGATLLQSVHPKALGTAAPLGASAGSWFFPHGGGRGWR